MIDQQTAVAGTGKARWTRLATLGFVLATAAPLIMLAAGAIWGLDLGEAGFLLVPAAVLGLVSFLVWRFGTWAKVVGIVFGLLAGLVFFWLIFGLFVPGNFFDFVPSLLYVPGILLGVGSCIGSIVARRRGHMTPAAEAGEARGIRIALTIVVLLSVLSGILTLTGRSTADATGADQRIAMKDFEFNPKTISVAGGSRLFVENDDPFFHTFTVKELSIDESFTVGSSKIIDIPDRPGTYIFYCEPHSDPTSPDPDEEDGDMAGRITVT